MLKVNIAKCGAVIVSIATFVLGITLPETTWIDKNRAVYVSIVALAALIIGGILWFVGIKVAKSKIDKTSPLHTIVPTLEKMDTLLKAQTEKESKRNIDLTEYLQLNQRINTEIFNITPDKAENPEEVKKAMSKIESQLTRKYSQSNMEALLPIMNQISGVLDRSGYGLKRYRERGKYKKLMLYMTKLRNNITDEDINATVGQHIIVSETLANMFLLARRGENIKAKYQNQSYGVLDFMSLPLVSLFSQVETSIREYMIKMRVEIGNRINKLSASI